MHVNEDNGDVNIETPSSLQVVFLYKILHPFAFLFSETFGVPSE